MTEAGSLHGCVQLVRGSSGARPAALLVSDHVPGGADGGQLQQTRQEGAHQRRHHQLQHQLRLVQLPLENGAHQSDASSRTDRSLLETVDERVMFSYFIRAIPNKVTDVKLNSP